MLRRWTTATSLKLKKHHSFGTPSGRLIGKGLGEKDDHTALQGNCHISHHPDLLLLFKLPVFSNPPVNCVQALWEREIEHFMLR